MVSYLQVLTTFNDTPESLQFLWYLRVIVDGILVTKNVYSISCEHRIVLVEIGELYGY